MNYLEYIAQDCFEVPAKFVHVLISDQHAGATLLIEASSTTQQAASVGHDESRWPVPQWVVSLAMPKCFVIGSLKNCFLLCQLLITSDFPFLRPLDPSPPSYNVRGQSLKKTSSQSDLDSIKVFFGVDTGDPLLDITKNDPRDCREDVIARVFEDEAIAWERIICEVEAPSKRPEHGTLSDAPLPAKGQVCRVWRELTKTAFGQGVSYAVLVGDDVRFLSAGWTSEIKAEFSALHREAFTPFGAASASIPEGFGVLCFTDVGSPGFPGFPVLHRTHLDIFGEIFPAAFINQDADPWIFQVL